MFPEEVAQSGHHLFAFLLWLFIYSFQIPPLPPPFFFLKCPLQGIHQPEDNTAEMTEAPDQALVGNVIFKLYLPIAAAIHAPVPKGRGCTPSSEWSILEKEKKEFWRWSRETVFKRSRKYKGWNLGPWTVGILLLELQFFPGLEGAMLTEPLSFWESSFPQMGTEGLRKCVCSAHPNCFPRW